MDAAVEWAKTNAALPEEITAYGKTLGQLGHRMITGDGELVVIDEWGDEEQFRKFFDSAPRMRELEGAGITGPPEVSVFNSVDVPGTFSWSALLSSAPGKTSTNDVLLRTTI